jgi:hypothetical protein
MRSNRADRLGFRRCASFFRRHVPLLVPGDLFRFKGQALQSQQEAVLARTNQILSAFCQRCPPA